MSVDGPPDATYNKPPLVDPVVKPPLPPAVPRPPVPIDRSHSEQIASVARAQALATQAHLAARSSMWQHLHDVAHTALSPRLNPALNPALAAAAAAQAASTRAQLATNARYAGQGAAYLQMQKRQAIQASIAAAKAHPLDTGSGAVLEKLVAQAHLEQVKSGGAHLDVATITQLDAAYQAHVEAVAAAYAAKIDALKAFYTQDSHGNLLKPKDPADYAKARALYTSKDFVALQREYNRLYGTNGQNGAVSAWGVNRDAIAEFQRQHLYSLAQKTVFNSLSLKAGRGVSHLAAAPDKLTELANLAQSYIDPTKTSLKEVGAKGQEIWVPRTVKEEFEYRKAQYMAEMQRQYAQYQNAQFMHQRTQRLLALNSDPQEARTQSEMTSAAQQIGISNIKTPEDLKKVVDAALTNWDIANKRIFLGVNPPAESHRGPPSQRQQAYNSARAEAEKRFYSYMGATPPGLGDQIMNFGPIKGLTDVLGAGVGAIGSGIQAGISLDHGAPTSLIASTGNITLASYPPEMQSQLRAEAVAAEKAHPTRGGLKAALETVVRDHSSWFDSTPEGQKWRDDHNVLKGGFGVTQGRNTQEKQDITQKLQDFYNKFYSGNPGDKISALSSYGMSPFTPDSVVANLVFGIAADPTIALPLKFWTWGDRLKYAVHTTQDVNGLRKFALGARDWLGVTESKLREVKDAKGYLAEIAAGKSPEAIIEKIHGDLAGAKELTPAQKVMEQHLQDVGLHKLKPDIHQLQTWVEEMATNKVHELHIPYEDHVAQATKIESDRVAAEAAVKAASDKAVATAEAARLRVEASAQRAAETGRAAATATRAAETTKLAARLARDKPVVVQAVKTVAGASALHPTQIAHAKALEHFTAVKALHTDAISNTSKYVKNLEAAVAAHAAFVRDPWRGAKHLSARIDGKAAFDKQVAQHAMTLANLKKAVVQSTNLRNAAAVAETQSRFTLNEAKAALKDARTAMDKAVGLSPAAAKREAALAKQTAHRDALVKTIKEAGAPVSHDFSAAAKSVEQSVERLKALAVDHEALLAKGRVPSAAAIKQSFALVRKASRVSGHTFGSRASLDVLKSISPSLRAHASIAVQRAAHENEILLQLNNTIRRTIDGGILTPQADAQLRSMAAAALSIPQGENFLKKLSIYLGSDTMASRLAVYLKHAEWFSAHGNEIQAAYDAGHIAEGQALNIEKGIAAGGTVLSGGSMRPSAAELNSIRASSSGRALEILSGMSEDKWLARELERATRAFKSATTRLERTTAASRIRNAEFAQKVISVQKHGGSYISDQQRVDHMRRVVAAGRERAAAVFPANMISPYVTSVDGTAIEQGRMEHVLLSESPVMEDVSTAIGEVSQTYLTHGKALEAYFDKPISPSILKEFGFPPDLLGDLSPLDLLTSDPGEFIHANRNPLFAELMLDLSRDSEKYVGLRTGDPTYTLRQFLADRIANRSNLYDPALFPKHEAEVSTAIRNARGYTRNTLTNLRRVGLPLVDVADSNPLRTLIDNDVRDVLAKTRRLKELGADPHQYNEARTVLNRSLVRQRTSESLVLQAEGLATKGGAIKGSVGWQAAVDTHFLALRDDLRHVEAESKLGELAGEMVGSPVEDILQSFEDAYSLGGDVKGFVRKEITPFQQRTLEAAVNLHLGIKDYHVLVDLKDGLSKFGQSPPFENRARMRDWLQKYGLWTPRTVSSIESGSTSWSIQEEAKYYRSHWGHVPDWADPNLLHDGQPLSHLRFDESAFTAFMVDRGVFNRNLASRFTAGAENMSRTDMIHRWVHGDEALGIKAKRDLATERKFVFERFGKLASPDGKTLTAFPWLMHVDEYRSFVLSNAEKVVGTNLAKTPEQITAVTGLIEKYMGKYFDESFKVGKTATYEDLMTVSANIMHDLLADPSWLRRGRKDVGNFLHIAGRDDLGGFLHNFGAIQRSLVFTNPGFAVSNAVDILLKHPLTAFNTRAFRTGTVSKEASALTGHILGWDASTTLLKDIPVHGTERMGKSVSDFGRSSFDGSMSGAASAVLRGAQGFTEIPAQIAGRVESFSKLRLAQGMYDGVKADFLKELKDPALAEAATLKFISKEVPRLWPTVGDGPIEKMFNELSPFMSYQFKNRTLFIGEFMSHPAFYNYLNRIGDAVEAHNRQEWAKTHPVTQPLTDNLARLIELPWAPGVFFDVGSLSDASRGLKPLYKMAGGGGMTITDFSALWVRLVNPAEQNIAGSIFNHFNLFPRYDWKPILDASGSPTGRYERVQVPWQAPWGGVADWKNSFWPLELLNNFQKASGDGLTIQEATVLGFQALAFGGTKIYDRGAGLNMYYWALKGKNPDAAKAFMLTADGTALRSYWVSKAFNKGVAFYTPEVMVAVLNPSKPDPNPWLHSQSPEYQAKIHADLAALDTQGAKWDDIIARLTPGTQEYSNAKLEAATAFYQFYASHPEMYEFQSMHKTPEQWAATLGKFQTDQAVQGYYNMVVPKQGDFKTAALWQAAVMQWKTARVAYLKAFPTAAAAIGAARTGMEGIWAAQEQGWFNTLDQIGTRSIAIEAARQSKDFPLTDQLYLLNELQYSTLSKDTAVFYYDKPTDFLKGDTFGHPLLSRVKILPDFNSWRFSRMTEQQKSDAVRSSKYAEGIKSIIAMAKGSSNFGATFVQQLKQHPDLLAEYFRRNPGKREQWASTDSYIKTMMSYGALVHSGQFTKADALFKSIPDWMKARYYAKHPEKKAALAKNMEYMSFMNKWTNFYRHRDYAGGAAYFDKLPTWVKDQYSAKHPQGSSAITGKGTSPYAKAMGTWVGMLQKGDHAGAKTYFDSLPQAFKDRYYAKHPQQKIQSDIKHTGMLGQYFAADDAGRAAYINANPEFAMWLKANDTSASQERMLIAAAYSAIPKDDQWLKRVFREKFPAVFSQQSKGDSALKAVYKQLTMHPDLLPAYNSWVAGVWASYAEEIKNTKAHPRPVLSDHSRERQHGTNRVAKSHHGMSAAWVRIHSIT